MAQTCRTELGDFLRSRRQKLSPESVGLPGGRKRRTPGLRREEVAELAGIGMDWYGRLEQGRNVTPSAATVNSLAQALRLSPPEHAHLRALAQNTARPPLVRESVPEPLRRLVESLDQPAYIASRRWDLLLWNTAAAEIFATLCRRPQENRNVLLYMLTDPDARRLFEPEWAEEAQRMVARFRATSDLQAGDPAFCDLVERLRQGSPEFGAWWAAHDVRSEGFGLKRLNHPQRGRLCFEYTAFEYHHDPALVLLVYTLV